jgi:hypothetical protein
MKKLFMYFALALTVLAMPAMAQAELIKGWDMNLGSYGTIQNIDFLTATGDGVISQDLGGNGAIDPGDTFTATSLIYTVAYTPVGGTSTPMNLQDAGNNAVQLFFYSDSLSGQVSASGLGGFSYEYLSGDITMYIGDKDNIGTATELATLSLDSAVGQTIFNAPGAGNYASGDTDMITKFDDSVLGSLIEFNPAAYPSLSAYPWLSAFFVFDFNNILKNAPRVIDDNTLEFDVNSNATITLVATPEPSTFLILGFGLLGLVGFRRKFRK